MTVLDSLDAQAIARWCERSVTVLAAARSSIDDLNVYPVPDGDTGTNLLLTMSGAADAVRAAVDAADPAALPDVCRAMSRGALIGARGNSGAILAQLLRGFAEVVAAAETVRGPELWEALTRGAELARASVEAPVEGTVLTVARAAAESAGAGGQSLAGVSRAAARGAAAALARTTAQLDVLAAAGVVDAGGRGLCLLLDALVDVVTGCPDGSSVSAGRVAGEGHPPAAGLPRLPVVRDGTGVAAAREAGSARYAYEVQYLLALPRHAEQLALATLRRRLSALGDSLVVVGGDGLYAVHVHVDEVGAAIEAGIDAGSPSRITVTRFADQAAADQAARDADQTATDHGPAGTVQGPPPPAPRRSVIVVARGAGLADLARQAGAQVVDPGPSAPVTTDDLVAAVVASGSAEVVVLPADETEHAAAHAAAAVARSTGRTVTVVPTRSVVQSLSALAVADHGRPLADDVVAMSSAAAATRWAAVAVAGERAQTSAGVCEAGDVLALVEGDVALIGQDLGRVATELLDRLLLAGGELVTLVTGEEPGTGEAAPELAGRLLAHLREAWPGLDVVTYAGGPAYAPLLIGVE